MDSSIKFEYIICLAFDCIKHHDPFCLAHTGTYNSAAEQNNLNDVRFGLLAAIKKIITDKEDLDSEEIIERLRVLENNVWTAATIKELDAIINEVHHIFTEQLFLKFTHK